MCKPFKKIFTLSIFCLIFSYTQIAAAANEVRINLSGAGLTKEIKENIYAHLSIYILSQKKELPDKTVDDLFQRSSKEIATAVKPFGYYNAKIESDLEFDIKKTKVKKQKKKNSANKNNDTKESSDGNTKNDDNNSANKDNNIIEEKVWTANYRVELGQPIVISSSKLNIKDHNIKDFAKLENIIDKHLQSGNILNQQKYSNVKESILDEAINLGYLTAKWESHKIFLDTKHNKCTIELNLKLGDIYTFGDINFSETEIKESLLIKMVPFQKGEYYSTDKINTLQSNFKSSGYYSHIDTTQKVNKENKSVDIYANLLQNNKNQIIMGGGINSDEIFRATFGWHRRFIGGNGNSFNLKGYISEKTKIINFKYTWPGLHPITHKHNAGYEADDELYYKRRVKSAKLFYEYEIKRDKNRYFAGLYGLLSDTNDKTTTVEKDFSREFIAYANYDYFHVGINDDTYISSGSKYNLNGKIGVNRIIESTEHTPSYIFFLQGKAKLKKLFSLNQRNSIILSSTFGFTYPQQNYLSDKMLFFTGGDKSLRGYSYRSIGNVETYNSEDIITGANYLLVFNAEYLLKLYDEVSALVFIDAGDATNTIDFTSLKKNIGVGIKWQILSVGAIKISIAKPLTDYKFNQTLFDSGFRLNFSFDTYF